jgi:predicted outer membrane protein
MDNKQLKKVFEFISTMLDDDSDMSEQKNTVQIETEIEPEPTSSIDKLSKKHNLDLDHIRNLMKNVDDGVQLKNVSRLKDVEILELRKEIKRLKELNTHRDLSMKASGLVDRMRTAHRGAEETLGHGYHNGLFDTTEFMDNKTGNKTEFNRFSPLNEGNTEIPNNEPDRKVKGIEVVNGELKYVYEDQSVVKKTDDYGNFFVDASLND